MTPDPSTDPTRREALSDWLEVHHAQANPTEVRLLEQEINALKAANRAGKARLSAYETALRELVRLKDLKESDPAEYREEDAVGAKDEAWHVARALLSGGGGGREGAVRFDPDCKLCHGKGVFKVKAALHHKPKHTFEVICVRCYGSSPPPPNKPLRVV